MAISKFYPFITEADFLEIIGTEVLRVFLLAIPSHLKRVFLPPPLLEQKWFETGV
jgi:hypothetical protein